MNALLPLGLPAQRATATAGTIETAFTAIRVEGGLFPAEFLQRVAKPDPAQKLDAGYGVPPGRTLRDEIGRYWTIAEALWREYKRDRERSDLPAERVAIERWLTRLLRDVLGYTDLTKVPAAQVGERGFPIRHRAHDGAVPLLLTTHAHDLDRSHSIFGDEGRRRAPHAAMQEYLNAEATALWGVVANGNRLRLLRDNPSLTRPAYVEADLERIFEEGLYPDFAALWLIAHATRVAPGNGGMAGCWLERWRAEAAKTGQRALERLRAGVTTALRELGSGFVEHTQNEALRAALRDGTVTAEILHQQLLRLVYRLLFLFTAEERGLLHAPDATPEARALYAQGYGLARLRDRARRRRYYDGHADLWTGLSVTFRALARGAAPLGVPALGGLFEEDQCAALDTAALPNARLLSAIHALAFFEDKGSLQRVNYRDMGTEELGSVYESLLELHPVVQVATRPWTFAFAGDEAGGTVKGSERKLSGSYYTPDSLVQELLRSALDPVIERALRENPTDPRGALLRLRVLDPACGSGHFLLGAARRLADAVARLDMEGDLPDEAARRRALREVVRRCIFGVDRNPLSVELCRTALWIEAIEPGKPLSFLDAHIKCGDSLIGVADLKVLKAGIPDEAFKELTGDDKAYCRDLRKQNKGERDNPTLTLLPEVALPPDLAAAIAALTDAPEDTLAAVQDKRRALRKVTEGRAAHDLRVACDLWCAAFFASKATRPEMRGRDMVPTTDTVWRYLRTPSSVYGPLVGAVEEMRSRLRFFHWPLEFPDVIQHGGFDAVVGNPPWEKYTILEREFFALFPQIVNEANAAKRERAIESELRMLPALAMAWNDAQREASAKGEFVRGSGRFPQSAVGELNLYPLFAELGIDAVNKTGWVGLILKSLMFTGSTWKNFTDYLVTSGRLHSVFDFKNWEMLFSSVGFHERYSLATLGPAQPDSRLRLAVGLTNPTQLADFNSTIDVDRTFPRRMNPETATLPQCETPNDLRILSRVAARFPTLGQSDWNARYSSGLHMTSDAAELRDRESLQAEGFELKGSWFERGAEQYAPVYEGKFIHQYDHRFATFDGIPAEKRFGIKAATLNPTARDKARRDFEIVPRYWVRRAFFEENTMARSINFGWNIAFRDTTNVISNFRTAVACIVGPAAFNYKCPNIVINGGDALHSAIFLSMFNSTPYDYIIRQKFYGANFTKSLLLQSFVINRSSIVQYEPRLLDAVARLTNTSDSVKDFIKNIERKHLCVNDARERIEIRAWIDAVYFRLFGFDADEVSYVFDTFPIWKEKSSAIWGHFIEKDRALALLSEVQGDTGQ